MGTASSSRKAPVASSSTCCLSISQIPLSLTILKSDRLIYRTSIVRATAGERYSKRHYGSVRRHAVTSSLPPTLPPSRPLHSSTSLPKYARQDPQTSFHTSAAHPARC